MEINDDELATLHRIKKGDLVTFTTDYGHGTITYRKGHPIVVQGRRDCKYKATCDILSANKTCGGWLLIREKDILQEFCPYESSMAKRIVPFDGHEPSPDINILSALS